MKRKILLVLGILLVVGALLAVGTYLYVFRTDKTDMLRLKTDFTIGAVELYEQFESDEDAAMKKFAGKILEVSGAVESIEKNEWGHVTISFIDSFFGVTCTIDSLDAVSQSEHIGMVAPGDSLVIKGRCDGMLTDVKLVKCLIIN